MIMMMMIIIIIILVAVIVYIYLHSKVIILLLKVIVFFYGRLVCCHTILQWISLFEKNTGRIKNTYEKAKKNLKN